MKKKQHTAWIFTGVWMFRASEESKQSGVISFRDELYKGHARPMWKNTPFFSSNTAIRHGTGVLQ